MLPNPNLKIVPNRVKKLPDELDREVMDTFLCIWLFRETAALEIYEKKTFEICMNHFWTFPRMKMEFSQKNVEKLKFRISVSNSCSHVDYKISVFDT